MPKPALRQCGEMCFFDAGRPRGVLQANQTILSLIGTSAREPSITPGNRKVFGRIHRQ